VLGGLQEEPFLFLALLALISFLKGPADPMPTWKHYAIAHSIEDALEALRSSTGPSRLVAGGTDYLLELQQGHQPPVDTLVDITSAPELGCLEIRGERLFIGAAVPVSRVALSPLVNEHARAVAEGCGLIGGPQVRNSATLGGNVAHALPAADGMIGLVALDAEAEIALLSEDGRVVTRCAPMLSLFAGPGKSTLDPARELLVGFYLPLRQAGEKMAEASAFARVMRPQGVALPILNLSVWLRREGEIFADLRVAVGPAGPVPQRARAVEGFLRGSLYSPERLAQAQSLLAGDLRFRTSPRRSTAEYRHHLVGSLFEKVLSTAWERAG
jgi:xanthine dehydrogenase FAD-binding subunit